MFDGIHIVSEHFFESHPHVFVEGVDLFKAVCELLSSVAFVDDDSAFLPFGEVHIYVTEYLTLIFCDL